MQARERVRKALAHQEPDRVPRDLGTTNATSIHIQAYRKLARYLGSDPEDYDWATFRGQSVTPSEEILQKLKIDTRKVQLPGGPESLRFLDEAKIVDDMGMVSVRPQGGYYFDPVAFPLEEGSPDLESLRNILKAPTKDISEEIDRLEAYARWLHEETDYAVIGVCDFYGSLIGPMSLQKSLLCLATDPECLAALNDVLLEVYFATKGEFLKRICPYVDMLYIIGEDFAGQDGPLMSPATYREIFLPRQKRIVDYARQYTDAPLMMHQCGAIRSWIPDLIEIGINVLNPIQVSARNMSDTAELKREFGERLVFWGGGINTQTVLSYGTPDEVKAEVKRRVRDLAPGGGYVFCPVHNIQPEVPPENIMAMYEALDEAGSYPIL